MVQGIILLSGSPGTGKTTIANCAKSRHGVEVISLGIEVIAQELHSGKDPERDTFIVDPDKFSTYFNPLLTKTLKESPIIIAEGHYADMIDHPKVVMGITLRCHPVTLEKRLQARNYSESKI